MMLRTPAEPSPRLASREIGLAIFGGALALGLLVGALDARQPGVRGETLATIALAITYVAGIVALVHAWLRQHPRTRALGDFLALPPDQFEAAVGDLLSESGYAHMRRVGGSGDLAADLVCQDASGRTVVVQCKRYAPERRVGSQAIQTFIGMVAVHHRAHRGVFVTTSEFTTPAIELAREHGITLIDGPALVALAQGVASGGTYQQLGEEAYAPA
ncbi:MAG: restriction endonuclease [Ktedonobacterales bacterium]|nr:restriction endonuclease [Ktedonobacterales bacterium]